MKYKYKYKNKGQIKTWMRRLLRQDPDLPNREDPTMSLAEWYRDDVGDDDNTDYDTCFDYACEVLDDWPEPEPEREFDKYEQDDRLSFDWYED